MRYTIFPNNLNLPAKDKTPLNTADHFAARAQLSSHWRKPLKKIIKKTKISKCSGITTYDETLTRLSKLPRLLCGYHYISFPKS